MEKSHATLTNLVSDETLWKLANHHDAFVRRAIFRLLITFLDRQPQMLNSSLLSTHILNKGLHSSQTGSSLDFVKAILRLSEIIPTTWTTSYQGTGEKSASHRLLYFIRRGSQGGSITFWSYIVPLLKSIPDEVVFTSSIESSSENGPESTDPQVLPVLEALRAGVSSKDEPQSNAASAWNSYLDFCDFLTSKTSHIQSQFVQRYLFPIIYQFIRPSPELLQWAVAGPQQQMTCAKACDIAFRSNPEISSDEWNILSSKLVEDFQTSLPEQSKDYTKSQDSIAAEALRWYRLQASLIGGLPSESFTRTVRQQWVQEITAAISILITRKGKPYGVAAALHILVQTMAQPVLKEISAKNALLGFSDNNIPQLMMSPSATYLVRLLDAMEDHVDVRSAYMRCIESIENSSEYSAAKTAMKPLLSSPGVAKSGSLSTVVKKILAQATDDVLLENAQHDSSLLMAALQNPFAPKEVTDDILSVLTKGLSIENTTHASLCMLDFTTKHNRTAISDFTAHSEGSELIAKLLFLSERPDTDISQQAKQITREIQDVLEITGNVAQNTQPLFNAIQKNFRTAGVESLTSVISFVGC